MLQKTKIIIILLCLISFNKKGQDYLQKSPTKAATYSSLLPGLGQAYTKKYWKIPIIYAGLITSGYYFIKNNNEFNDFKNSYLKRINNENDQYQDIYTDNQLITLINNSKRNREISALVFIGTYVLNIIDASVNAHLFSHDVSDDLTLKVHPAYFVSTNTSGIRILLTL